MVRARIVLVAATFVLTAGGTIDAASVGSLAGTVAMAGPAPARPPLRRERGLHQPGRRLQL